MNTKNVLMMFFWMSILLGQSAFGADTFTYTVANEEATITGYTYKYASTLAIPATMGGKPVTAIGGSAFMFFGYLNSITIPDTVRSIGFSAFQECGNLSSITLPADLISIAGYAFFKCKKLTSIIIPAKVPTVGWLTFGGCTALTSIDIPFGVTLIDDGAFSGCTALTSVTIPESVTRIGSSVFNGCILLPSITLPRKITAIDDYTFASCDVLTSIIIPDKVTGIHYCAFSGCNLLTEISIPEGVTFIDPYAFSWCRALTTITLPDSLSFIDSYAFKGCTALTTISLPESVGTIKTDTFLEIDNLVVVNINRKSSVECFTNNVKKTGILRFLLNEVNTDVEDAIKPQVASTVLFNYVPSNLTLKIVIENEYGYYYEYEVAVSSASEDLLWDTTILDAGAYSITSELVTDDEIAVASDSTIVIITKADGDADGVITSDELFDSIESANDPDTINAIIALWGVYSDAGVVDEEFGESTVVTVRKFIEVPNDLNSEILVNISITPTVGEVLPKLVMVNEILPVGWSYVPESSIGRNGHESGTMRQSGQVLSWVFYGANPQDISFDYRLSITPAVVLRMDANAISISGTVETNGFTCHIDGLDTIGDSTQREWHVTLQPGWNLLSLPFMAETISGNVIWVWDCKIGAYMVATQVEALQGFWIYSDSLQSYSITGGNMSTCSVIIKCGWNLFGPLYDTACSELFTNYNIYKYSSNEHNYQYVDTVEPGVGFWIFHIDEQDSIIDF